MRSGSVMTARTGERLSRGSAGLLRNVGGQAIGWCSRKIFGLTLLT